MTSTALTIYNGFRDHDQGLDEERISLRKDIQSLLDREGAEFDLIKSSLSLLRKYPDLASLKSRIKYPEDIVKVDILELTRLIQDLEDASRTTDQTAKDIFQSLAAYYRNFQQQYNSGTNATRAVLLSPKAQIEGDLIGSYRISQDVAHKFLSRNQYGDIVKSNITGNHPVVAVGGLHLKSATEHEPLDTAMEIGVYLLHSLLFGKEIGSGLAPSSLLTLENVLIDGPATRLTGKDNDLFENAIGCNRRGSFIRRHKCPVVSTPQTYSLQASKTIEGQRLDDVLSDPNFDSITWDEENFSALILASFLTIPSDNKPDNFMVVMDSDRLVCKIVGIDNDMAFAYPIAAIGQKQGHLIGLKNALLCFDKMMKKPIAPKVRERIAKLDPILFALEWAAAVKQQEQRYASHITNQVKLPLLFTKDTLQNLIENLQVLQKTASDPDLSHVSHREIFRILFPVVERYYQRLAKATKSTPEKIENLFSPRLPTVEEYLKDSFKKDERLEDNRTLREALMTSQRGVFAYQNERDTSIEEACYEVLRVMDLSQLPSEQQCAILSLAASFFPAMADKNVHVSWRSDALPFALLHSRDCGHIIPFLQTLGVNLQAKNEDGDTLLHLCLKQEKNPPKELLKCTDLETPNNMGLTPLDIAMDHKLSDITIALIDAGAGATASSSRAWEFYTNVVETKQDPHLTEAFQRLVRSNQTISWKMAKEIILPPKGDEKDVVRSALNGERKLHPDAAKQLFREDGALKAVNTSGKRAVGKATIDGFTLYFKQAPELPGVEQAVGTLMRQVMGFGTPHTDLVRINGIPYLVSQEIPGPTLQEVLENNPEQLKKLDKKCLSQLLLMSMLINFEDGKPDNYIFEPTANGFRIVSIDNDHAFVPSVAKETLFGNKQNKVQVKTVLYCLDQMKDPIDPSVREQFLLHDPAMILMTWLGHLSNIHDLYTILFDEEERRGLFNNSGVFVGIPFRQEMVTNLYRKMVKMQFLLDQQKKNAKFSHMDLLSALDQPLGDRYSRGFKKQQNPMDRFLEIDGKDYEIKGKNIISTRHAKEILQSYNITTMADIQALIQKGTALNVEGAIRELQVVVNKDQNALVLRHLADEGVRVDLASLNVDQVSALLLRMDFSKIPPHVVQSILSQIRRYVWKELRLLYSPMITNAYLRGLNFTNITDLDLSDCQSLTDQVVGQILGQAPQLRKLNLSRNSSFEKIQGSSWGQGTPMQMNKVSHLYVNNCPRLNTLAITGNELAQVQCEENDLVTLVIQSPSLGNLSLRNNKRLTNEALTATTSACDNLKRLDLEGCDQITEKELKMLHPTYPFHLLAKCSPNLRRLIYLLLTNNIKDFDSEETGQYGDEPATLKQTTRLQKMFQSDKKLKEKEEELEAQKHRQELLPQITALSHAVMVNSSLSFFRLHEVNLLCNTPSSYKLDSESIKYITRMLKVNKSLVFFDLSNNYITDESAIALANSLRENSTLKDLWLHDNPIGPEGLRAIFNVLQVNRNLDGLRLGVINEQEAVVVADFLRSNAALSILAFKTDRKSLKVIAKALEDNNFLKDIELQLVGEEEMDDESASIIASFIRRNKTLTKLNLSGNRIGDKGAKVIAGALAHNNTLESLTLDDNDIDSDGLKDLIDAFERNTSLKQFSISRKQQPNSSDKFNSTWHDSNLMLFIRLFKLGFRKKYLTYDPSRFVWDRSGGVSNIDLQSASWTEDAIKALVDLLESNRSTIKQLDLQNSSFPGDDVLGRAGDDVFGRKGTSHIFNALKTMSELTHLNLANTKIDYFSAKALAQALKENNSLVEVLLNNCSIIPDGIKAILDALKINTTVKRLGLSLEGNKDVVKFFRCYQNPNLIEDSSERKEFYDNFIAPLQNPPQEHIETVKIVREIIDQVPVSFEEVTQAIEEFLKSDREITISLEVDNDKRELFFDVLRKNPESVTKFDLTLKNTDETGIRDLIEILKTNRSIEALCLDVEKISDENVSALSQVLINNKMLRKLKIKALCKEAMADLARALEVNTSLDELSIRINSLTDVAEALAKALTVNNSLKVLNFDGSYVVDILSRGLISLAYAEQNNKNWAETFDHNEPFNDFFNSQKSLLRNLMKKAGFIESDSTELCFTRDINKAERTSSSIERPPAKEIGAFPSTFSYVDSNLTTTTPDTLFTQGKVLEKTDVHEAIDRYLEAAKQKHQEALKRLQALSESSLQAQYSLGCYFEEQNDLKQAVFHYVKGAAGAHLQSKQALYRLAENDPIAQSQLAVLLENGTGMKQNIGEALLLHKKASDKGVGLSKLHLGVLYHMGYSTEENKSLALSLIDQAVTDGVLQADVIKKQIQRDTLEKQLIIQKAANDDQALFLLANKRSETDLFSQLPFLDKEAFVCCQEKINKAETEVRQREVDDILQSIGELEQQVQQGTSTQAALLRKRIDGLRQKVTELQKQQKVQLDVADDARKFLLNEKRKLFYTGFQTKVSNILQAVNAILAGEASRNISLQEQATSTVVKGAIKAIDMGIHAAASVVPFAGVVVNVATYGIEKFLKHKKDEEIKRQCRKIQSYYPDQNLKGTDALSTLLATGLVYRFQDQLPHLNGESLDRLANNFALGFTDYLSEKAPEDASVYDLIVGGALTKLGLKNPFMKKSLMTAGGMEWMMDDLMFSTGMRTIYGGKYLPKDPKRRAFIQEMEKKSYPIYRWGTKEEMEILKSMGIEMECIEEERIGALATNIDSKKAAARYMLEADSLANQFLEK